jgi:hypothetical protein
MKFQTLTLLMGLSFGALAQGSQPAGTTNNNLDISNINATIQTGGDFFCKNPGAGFTGPNSMTMGFEIPKGSGIHTIFAGALWVGARDAQNNLYTTTQTYRQFSPQQAGYWPGPIATTQNPAFTTKYDKIWKVSKAQILNHIANYNKPGYILPPEIATWPGNGDILNGEAAQLAPFKDLNNDGIYTPAQGDYPFIKGDQALYLILNDKGNVKVPISNPMNAEIHVMYYGFNNPTNGVVYNTVFSEYRIINRGLVSLKDLYAGIWADVELGNWADDYVGCDTTTNRFYVYNGDNFDQDTLDGNKLFKGYGANPPVQSIMFLDKRMSHFLYYTNNMHPTTGNPDKASDYYNYLKGIWRDGKLLTYGGNGTNQAIPSTTHMFAGNPVTLTGWSERNTLTTPAANVPFDRRGLGSIGPYDLNPGQELKFTVAYAFSQGTSNLNSVTQSQQDAQTVRNFFRNTVIAGTKPEQHKQPLVLFPNPATDQLSIQLPDNFDNRETTILITDYTGREVLRTTAAGKHFQLNIGSLSKGIYQISVTFGSQHVSSRLVKL